MPRLKLIEPFDGNPRTYCKFVNQFQYFVEQCVIDDGMWLQYLKHFCVGQAREAISGVYSRDAAHGYAMAWDLLESLYGRDEVVTNAVIEDVLKNLKNHHDSAESLSNLPIRMGN